VEFDPTLPDRGAYLQEAAKSLLIAMNLAVKFKFRQRLVLTLVEQAKLDMLSGNTTSAIKNAEKALAEAGPQARTELKGYVYFLLSRAYEADQSINKHLEKAIENHQKYIDLNSSSFKPDEMRQAQARLISLKAKLADRTQ
jgi:tetratricopeptide (TPR) repeat protein